MKCIQCNQEYEAKRSTSQYCSAKCRKLAFREQAKNAKPGTVIPITPGTVKDPEILDKPERPVKPKRGKDIKTFEDLPPDVQATIKRVSQSNEEYQRRVQAAIKYQHLFPDSWISASGRQPSPKAYAKEHGFDLRNCSDSQLEQAHSPDESHEDSPQEAKAVGAIQ